MRMLLDFLTYYCRRSRALPPVEVQLLTSEERLENQPESEIKENLRLRELKKIEARLRNVPLQNICISQESRVVDTLVLLGIVSGAAGLASSWGIVAQWISERNAYEHQYYHKIVDISYPATCAQMMSPYGDLGDFCEAKPVAVPINILYFCEKLINNICARSQEIPGVLLDSTLICLPIFAYCVYLFIKGLIRRDNEIIPPLSDEEKVSLAGLFRRNPSLNGRIELLEAIQREIEKESNPASAV